VADDLTADLVVSRSDDVVEIEIDHGPANHLNAPIVAAIVAACREAAESGARAVVLCSAGRHFCAGVDLVGEHNTTFDGRHLYDHGADLIEQPLPIVAAIQGAAIGGGLGLALLADLRVAAPEARLSANFATLGLHPGFGTTVTLPLTVGQAEARRLFYTGVRVSGEEAVRLGLCSEVVPLDQLREVAHHHAAQIARSAPLAVQAIRRTLWQPVLEQYQTAIQHERREQDRLRATDDFVEGVEAMKERREPRFNGR
jgi:2-(1,2-epoxy-1,2-dihydrophenyl)acetyl-CoA isomerase